MIRREATYDVVVVGSGAGGGMSVYALTHAGYRVLMLEVGRSYDPATETPMFNMPADAPLRAAPTPDKQLGYFDPGVNYLLPDEPYTVAEGSNFLWFRARILGGRTNHWGRKVLRYGPYDFKAFSRDGHGVDWPVTYDDIAPWYEKVERLIGVTGAVHGLENMPDSPPDAYLPPPPPTAGDYFIKRGLESMGIPVAAIRAAVLTRPHNGRPACMYATPCARGCSIAANFQTPTVLIPPAYKTGNLTVRTHAAVYQVDIDKSGRAKGVSYVDRRTGEHHSVQAKSVILAASTCETARILLNSRSSLFPDGLANENGQVGRNLMDNTGSAITAHFPALEKLPVRNDDGISVGHLFAPWWGHSKQVRKELDFPRGYQIVFVGGRTMPAVDQADYYQASHGPTLREEIRRKYGSFFMLGAEGEMIPNPQSFCEIDSNVKDKWGIPVLRFHFKFSDYETRLAAHARRTMAELVSRLGGEILPGNGRVAEDRDTYGGESNHEVGTARMGSSPKNSVVNQFGQSWSVKNLFITDGSVFASCAYKNPTLTIMALSWRSTTQLIDEARRGNL